MPGSVTYIGWDRSGKYPRSGCDIKNGGSVIVFLIVLIHGYVLRLSQRHVSVIVLFSPEGYF